MNREITQKDTRTMSHAERRESDESKTQEDTAIVGSTIKPLLQGSAAATEGDFFWNHRNRVFIMFFGGTSTILLALIFVLWAGLQIW
jgi:hypothetical protein